MSAASNTAAYQEIAAVARAACNGAGVIALLGTALPLQYPNVLLANPTSSGKSFARLSVQNSGEKKRTLSKPSRVTKVGLANIQLCLPENMQRVSDIGYQVTDLLMKAFQGSTPNVNFSKSFSKPIPPAQGFMIWRIAANYDYDVLEG